MHSLKTMNIRYYLYLYNKLKKNTTVSWVCVILYVIVYACLELYIKNTCVHDFVQCLFYMTNIYRENRRSN